MAIIRLQEKTPGVYTWESRDFQLISRVYDSVINEVKYSVDSMKNITNTYLCKSNILPLLQTKLGFYTSKTIEDDTLRIILEAFPLLVKNKGSLLSIKQAIRVFLKAYKIKSDLVVWSTTSNTVVYGTPVSDHSIIIGVNSALQNMFILQEIFKYILPTGFSFYIYFYTNISDMNIFISSDKAQLIYASANINAQLRASAETLTVAEPSANAIPSIANLVAAVDTTSIASTDSPIGSFLGIFTDAPVTATDGYTYIKLNSDHTLDSYYRANNTWNKLTYKGLVAQTPASPSAWDVWTEKSGDTFIHKMYDGSTTSTKDAIHVLINTLIEEE